MEVSALKSENKKLVVMLHGVGSDGQDLISLVPFIQKDLPNFHFFSPNGLEPYDMAPFGYQWFSLANYQPIDIIKNLYNNAPKVIKIIKEKQDELEISNQDTILLGFSQGTMMGLHLTLNQDPEKEQVFAGMIAFSGRLIYTSEIKNFKSNICIIHGEEDLIVPASESIKLAKLCQNFNINHEILRVPNLGHSIDAKGLDFAINFIKKYCNN